MIRIIGGKHKGRKILAPKHLPVRPTTDFAKQGLFNILNNHFDFSEVSVLDLFCGTGNITYEFSSRGCSDITSVDADFDCIKFVKSKAEEMNMEGIRPYQSEVFRYLAKAERQWDIVFADPPYQMKEIPLLPQTIIENQLVKPGGWIIIEHPQRLNFSPDLPLLEKRVYGKVNFSIFSAPEQKP